MLDRSSNVGFWASRQIADSFPQFVEGRIAMGCFEFAQRAADAVFKKFRTSCFDVTVNDLPANTVLMKVSVHVIGEFVCVD